MPSNDVLMLSDHRRKKREGLHGEMSPVGFRVDPETTFDEWCGDGETLKVLHHSTTWAIADWLIWGKDRFGESHAQALGDYYAPETLARYEKVARAFPIERRRVSLYIGHHRAVTVAWMLPDERDEVLDLAEKNRWSRTVTEGEVKQRRTAKEAAERAAATVSQPSVKGLGAAVEAASTPPAEAEPAALASAAGLRPTETSPAADLAPGPTSEPPSPDDAADLLLSLTADDLGQPVMQAILVVLEQRNNLLELLAVARQTIADFDLPDLAEAVSGVL